MTLHYMLLAFCLGVIAAVVVAVVWMVFFAFKGSKD